MLVHSSSRERKGVPPELAKGGGGEVGGRHPALYRLKCHFCRLRLSNISHSVDTPWPGKCLLYAGAGEKKPEAAHGKQENDCSDRNRQYARSP